MSMNISPLRPPWQRVTPVQPSSGLKKPGGETEVNPSRNPDIAKSVGQKRYGTLSVRV